MLMCIGLVEDMNLRAILLNVDEPGINDPTASFWGSVKFMQGFYEPIVSTLHQFEVNEPILSKAYSSLFVLQNHIRDMCGEMDLFEEVKRTFDARWTFLANETMILGKMFTVFTIINGLQNNAITFSAHLLDPQQCGDKLNPAQIGALRLFIKEKVGDVFPLAWGQLLNYRAKSGVFGSIDVWEDSHLVDAITWWKIHGVETPQLQKLALSVLNIPTSSAASERCWSAMGNIHNTERNRLTDERIEKLTYIYFNERMLQDC
jgi:hypothetical protein